MKAFRAGLALTVIGLVLLAFGWRWFGPRTILVTSTSMEPSFSPADQVTYVRSKDLEGLKVGALVMVRSPRDGQEIWLRRVLGLPGQRLAIDGSELKIDGQVVDLTSVGMPVGTDFGVVSELVVPEGCVYLVGDNTATAIDSRTVGPFRRQELAGVVRSVKKGGG